MLDQGADEAAEREANRRQEGAERGQGKRPPGKGIREGAGHKDMQDYRHADQAWRGQTGQDDVQRIQDGRLDVRQERDPQEQIRVPQGQTPLLPGFGCVLAVGIEVGEHVQAHQYPVGQRDLPEEQEGEGQKARDGGHIAPPVARVTFAHSGSCSSIRYRVKERLPSSRKVS